MNDKEIIRLDWEQGPRCVVSIRIPNATIIRIARLKKFAPTTFCASRSAIIAAAIQKADENKDFGTFSERVGKLNEERKMKTP
jgi:hypothetical protein